MGAYVQGTKFIEHSVVIIMNVSIACYYKEGVGWGGGIFKYAHPAAASCNVKHLMVQVYTLVTG